MIFSGQNNRFFIRLNTGLTWFIGVRPLNVGSTQSGQQRQCQNGSERVTSYAKRFFIMRLKLRRECTSTAILTPHIVKIHVAGSQKKKYINSTD